MRHDLDSQPCHHGTAPRHNYQADSTWQTNHAAKNFAGHNSKPNLIRTGKTFATARQPIFYRPAELFAQWLQGCDEAAFSLQETISVPDEQIIRMRFRAGP